MASVRNAFDLLSGSGERPSGSSGAPKPKKKSKKKPSQLQDPSEVTETSAAPIAEAPVPAGSRPAKAPTFKEAGRSLEAAALAAGPGQWGALAEQWADQVQHGDALFTNGSQLVEFKEVLLKSKALDLLVAGYLERGASLADAPSLSRLLSAVAHPTAPPTFPAALAYAVAGLGQACATDRLAPAPSASRAAAAALGLLGEGMPRPPPQRATEPPLERLRRLAGELAKREAKLAGNNQPKELCKAYGGILEVLCGQLDALQPAAAAPPPLAPQVAAAMQPLEELRAALAMRLQEVQAPPKPQLSIPEQLAEAEAGHKREDAALQGRLSEVELRIASLEAELAQLKQEAGGLRTRRSAAAQHHARRLEDIRTGRQDSVADAAEVAKAVQGGLQAVDGLAAALRSSSQAAAGNMAGAPADTAALAQQVVAAEVPLKLLGAMQQVVEGSLVQLHELGGKARFYRERLEKAIKQGEQAVKLGVGDPKTFQQQRATAENNVKETLAAAEAASAAARGAVAAYRERLPIMLRLPSFLPPPPEYLAAIDARAAEADALLAAIKDGSYVPQPGPAATAAAPSAPAAAVPSAHGPAQQSHAPAAAVGGPAAPAVVAAPPPARSAWGAVNGGAAHSTGNGMSHANGGVSELEARLAALEAENEKKDAQIAAMVASTTLDVPSPLANRKSMAPAMLSPSADNKPQGTAAPIAPPAGPSAGSAVADALLAARGDAKLAPLAEGGPSFSANAAADGEVEALPRRVAGPRPGRPQHA